MTDLINNFIGEFIGLFAGIFVTVTLITILILWGMFVVVVGLSLSSKLMKKLDDV